MSAPYLEPAPVALAHRGGAAWEANAGNENSLLAFRHAVDLGFRYLETDARASADGVAFAFHDRDLSRVAPAAGTGERPFGTLTAETIRSVRLVGGEPIATIPELLAAFPDARLNIDVKTETVIEPVVRAIEEAGAQDRVLIASFDHQRLQRARRLLPGVATSASPREVVALITGRGRVRGMAARHGAVCVQVPERYRGRRLVTPRFIRIAHDEGLQVHVWTVDERDDMHRLLDAGVDGIITDRPDTLRAVLEERGQWRA